MSFRSRMLLWIFPALLAATPAAGQLEISGLVIDQTRTPAGRAFYQEFFNRWGEPKTTFSFNLVVKELADARLGSILSVDLNGTTAWRKMVRPRTMRVEEEAEDSVSQVRNYLLYMIRLSNEKDSLDMAGDGY